MTVHILGPLKTAGPMAMELTLLLMATRIKDNLKMVSAMAKALALGMMAAVMTANGIMANNMAKALTLGPMAASMLANGNSFAKHGLGTMTEKNGDKSTGQWVDGQMHGEFNITHPDEATSTISY